MPAGVVKTKEDEQHWEKAKAQVKKEYRNVVEGSKRFWKLVMSIFRRMKHRTGAKKPPATEAAAAAAKSYFAPADLDGPIFMALRKGYRKATTRKTKSGKVVQVRATTTKVTKKAPPPPKTKASPKKKPAAAPAVRLPEGMKVGAILHRAAPSKMTPGTRVQFQYRIESIDPAADLVHVRLVREHRNEATGWKARQKPMTWRLSTITAKFANPEPDTEMSFVSETTKTSPGSRPEAGPRLTRSQMRAAFVAAENAAIAAFHKTKPTPMIVQQHASVLDDNSPVVQEWVANEGVVGDAWVLIQPGTSSAARYALKRYAGNNITSPGKGKYFHAGTGGGIIGQGVYVMMGGPGKAGLSIERKEAAARVFAAELSKLGIRCRVGSRED